MDTPADASGPSMTPPMKMDPFSTYLGLEITEMTGSRVVATWTAKPQLHQPYGIVHGGAHCSVVESLGSIGSAVWLGDKGQCVGVNNNTDFFRAVPEGALTSVATPLHQGRSQQLWVVETPADETGKVVARGQLRVQNLYPRS